MKRLIGILMVFCGLTAASTAAAVASQIEYPQITKTRYEAVDQKIGGSFVIFSECEKIFYGLDAKLLPDARFVGVTQITPTTGSDTPTFVEIRTVAGPVSDDIHLTGNLRLWDDTQARQFSARVRHDAVSYDLPFKGS
jgi:hypothetical protein